MRIEELNPKNNPIIVKCKGADTLPVDRILEFQGNLKKLSKENREKLIKSICIEGFIAPMFLWDDQGEWKLLDGHGRLKALLWMREKGWDIPLLPVDYIEAVNEKDARRKLLKITSQYGEFEMDYLQEWLDDFDADIAESIRLVDQAIELHIGGSDNGSSDVSGDDTYTDKIKAPIYEMTGEKPEITDMVDPEKADSLINEIESSGIEDPELKSFLIAAAHRHVVFSYDKIAEYYAHSSPEVQDLMEKSALVIIDFDKAIENGFVKLSGALAKAYEEDTDGEG